MKAIFSHGCRAHPLLVLAGTAIAGILLAEHLRWPAPAHAAVLVVLGAGLTVVRRAGWTLLLPGVALLFAGLHELRLAQTHRHPLRAELLARPDRPEAVSLQGRLLPWSDGAELDESSALCDVSALRWGNAGPFLPVRVRVKVALPPGFVLDRPGLHELAGTLRLPRPPMNPGQFDGVEYGLRQGWVAVLQAQRVRLLQASAWAPRFHLLRAAENCRQWILRQLSSGLEDAGPQAAVIHAMALGASDAAGDDIEDAFRDSGTLHVFAVSGLHVVMLAGIAGVALRWLGLQRSALALIGLVFIYAFVTGWRPSAARAAFMTALLLLAPLANRRARLQNSLGAAALILLAADTHQLFQPGFQLSFGVLWAIALLAPPLLAGLQPWCRLDPFLPAILASRRQRWAAAARTGAASLACVSAAAWAGSLPFMIGHFQTVTPVALVANLILVPASGLCLTLACASLACAALQLHGAVVLANGLNALLAKLMVAAAGWFASWPGAHGSLDLRLQPPPSPASLRVFHLPGGGGASHLRCGTRHWLLDTGNLRPWRSVLRPYFSQQGINRLDGLILSHADMAHCGAAPLALASMQAARLHTSLHEPWRFDPPFASLRQLGRLTPPDGPVWQRHAIDARLVLAPAGGLPVTATVLHPGADDRHEKADDRALVLQLAVGRLRLLWLNDAGFITEKRLLERRADLACDILIRNQHGSDVSGLPELLRAAQPRALICAGDSRFPEETLPPELRQFCADQAIPLFDLEVCGSVGIDFEPDRAQLRAFRSGETLTLRAADR